MFPLETIFAFLLVTFVGVSAGRNYILIEDTRTTWISSGRLARMIEISLEESKCANVYLNDSSDSNVHIFEEFFKVYPYEYMINHKSYSCSGYLMICTTADKIPSLLQRVPAEISTTEIFIVVNDRVEASSQLLTNISLYGNANVNIATRNGIWSLSENYLEPRIFKKVWRYQDMKHKRGIVDLQGRKLQAAAFFKPPLSYLSSTINKTVNGVEGEFFLAANKSELDGVEVKIFLLLAEKLNFTWAIRKPNRFYRYGRRNGSDWNGGMIGQIFRKEIDIAFTEIWLEQDHYAFTNLSTPWTKLAIHFLVPRPKRYPRSFWALTKPLSPGVWTAVIFMVIFESVYVYTRAWVDPLLPARFRSIVNTWTELTARLMGIALSKKIRGLKLQLLLWHLTGVLIVTAYSSSLAARLANSDFEARIDTTEQFIVKNLTWGREGPTPKFTNYFSILDPWAMQFPSRFENEHNESERHKKIENGNYAIVGRIVGGVFFPENYVRDSDMKYYRLMKDNVGCFYSSFAMQPWLVHSVDQVLLRLAEAGLVVHHLRDVLNRRASSTSQEVLLEHDGPEGGPQVLKVRPLGAGFALLATGLILSTIIFYFELKSVSGNRPVMEVLRRIEKNRRRRRSSKELIVGPGTKRIFVLNKS
ncbi:probable glutamate receptor [Venturia canescens]|uniref:probable glutamate receptor n=1 Tax=Venturia canescens TaxID=32260 RepID=UPI001C9C4B8C|nr:probable glutamate receptor [Venturia canescens]XP_043287955.1 probable glutamate receptor [Venturia canescens]XP_043287956.1 probable glutamate receptor [Venturia canescens]XP_043287957.1 probable glutamate receptor [Venturia canescens]XP_043287958.1 probable glutamate receptor [Venturia canescens]XP_043287959.1 probable glutamate receptor [Venturia canescens]